MHRTPLFERHQAAGARIVPFAGWEMPVQYAGVREEHLAVRATAGVFDVSHMGQLELRGEDAHAYLQARLTNDLDRIGPGQAQYTLLPNASGGVVDDLIAYRRDAGYLLVVNASNTAIDAGVLAVAEDVSDRFAMLAVQGPEALARLEVEIAPFAFEEARVLGIDSIVCGGPNCSTAAVPRMVSRRKDAEGKPRPRAARGSAAPSRNCSAESADPEGADDSRGPPRTAD